MGDIERLRMDVVGEDRSWMLQKGSDYILKLATVPISLNRNFNKVCERYMLYILAETGRYVEEIYFGMKEDLDGLMKQTHGN